MYKTGDVILYGSTGVCRVTDIVTHGLPGQDKKQLHYVLKPLYQDCTITTPVDAMKVFMRPILTKDEAEQLVERIPSFKAEAFHSRFIGQLVEHYETAMKTYDCADLIEMTLSIHAKKQTAEQHKRKFGAVDEKYMKRVEALLYGELAAALDLTRDQVSALIAERVEKARGEQQCV